MQFETRVVSVEEQIACIGRVIESYKGIIRVFDEDGCREARDEMARDILELMAARESLRRISFGRSTTPSAVAAATPPIQGGELSAADVARFLENSATMRALREISGSQAGTPAVQSAAGGGRIL